jgi:hypothetical protein
VQSRDLRGRPVGEEVAQRDDRAEDAPGQGERRELRRAEVADDRRVGQEVERLGGQRAQRGDREPQDLAVDGGAALHRGHSTMRAMRRSAALAVSLGLAFGACTKESPPMPSTCIDTGRDGYERALAAVPGAVRLPGGAAISTCLERVRTDAELQNLGSVVHAVAEGLAERARGGAGDAASVDAARRLGYLSAAVSVGAGRSNGISAELARRVETTGVGVVDGPPAIARALAEGQAAGRARG